MKNVTQGYTSPEPAPLPEGMTPGPTGPAGAAAPPPPGATKASPEDIVKKK